ncbi:MAG TPA: GYD domain-containing protein [Terriglobia bacterium]|nr:GYD domain-containing protein [Terriglobia bacterium]
MTTYVTLFRWTQKGIENVKDSPARLDAIRKAMAAAGGSLKGFYLTTGQYDAVAIGEFPDDLTMARFALAGASQGFVRSETLKAFTEDEYRKIIASLP